MGKLGTLICGENANPLARFALIAQGEQVHVSNYPALPGGDAGGYDLLGVVTGSEGLLGVVTEKDTTTRLTSKHDIPIGHKVALTDLKKGDTVMKYGEDIGKMIADAKKGGRSSVLLLVAHGQGGTGFVAIDIDKT